MEIPIQKWVWKGLPGHFIGASDCIFRLCTIVGNYKVSTVGGYYPSGSKVMQKTNFNHHYETYVFIDGQSMIEIDSEGITLGKDEDPYNADKRAEKMHVDICHKYANKSEG